jgi:hypothetical protein
MAFDFGAMFSDPNFLQGLGNAGEVIGSGGSIAEALNPADLIRAIQTQKAGQDVLGQIFGTGKTTPVTQAGGGVGTGSGPGTATGASLPIEPTPRGQAGPDAVTTKRTADGETTTIQTPSAQNLSTFGTNVPVESITQPQPSGGGTLGPSPFFKSLFGV